MNKQIKLMNSYFWVVIVILLSIAGKESLWAQNVSVTVPTAFSNDTASAYQYYDLACNVAAWAGYFSPERWHRSVTAAAPSATVHVNRVPADGSTEPMIVLGQHQKVVETWTIEIPAAGYLSFRLLPAVSSDIEGLKVIINDRTMPFKGRADGLYYSPFLRPGDKFSLRIPAGVRIYHWTNLHFHTNYNAVIVRPREVDPARKYAPIEAALIERIFFLSNAPGIWPVFDQDGDLSSVDDQFELRNSNDRFKMEYHDQIEEEDGRFYLRRVFTIREKCNRGSWLRSPRRWVELPMVAE